MNTAPDPWPLTFWSLAALTAIILFWRFLA